MIELNEFMSLYGFSPKGLAILLGVPLGTLRHWLKGDRTPDPLKKRLITEKLKQWEKENTI